MKSNCFFLLALGICFFLVAGCSEAVSGPKPVHESAGSQGDDSREDASPLKLVATTGQINSALNRITAGTGAQVRLLCGPGVDPHSFSASTRDVQAMLDADLIVYNGFHLEAMLSEHLEGTFQDKSWSMASAFPASQRLDWVEDGEIDPDAPVDPHIWNHLPAWGVCVTGLAEHMAGADPAHADQYRENAAAYVAELEEAHQWACQKLSELPEDSRILISAHDAFGYFARNYGMTTGAPLGVGNDSEADVQTISEISELICEQKIPAIFLETITNPRVTQALSEACAARGWNVVIVRQPLYSDDLGEESPHDTFLGAFRSNVNVIYEALSSAGT